MSVQTLFGGNCICYIIKKILNDTPQKYMTSQYSTRHHLTISKDHILKTLTRNFNSKLKHGLFFIQQVLLVILVFFEANITTWGEIMIKTRSYIYCL